MNYVKKYIEEIRAGREAVSRKVRAVYERETGWMDNPPSDPDFVWHFDEDVGTRPIEFIERFCKHSKGKWAGKPVRLELFQKAKIQLAFGWIDAAGLRRFRIAFDVRGRKCGKSTETAGISLYMLIGDGEPGAECYAVANKLDQAKLVFNEAVNMRHQSPAIKSLTKKRQSDIYFPATMSILKAIASDSKTMDGLNAHFFSQDEIHEARTSKVFDVMIQSQSAREQPMAWLISTNGLVREAFFDMQYEYASNVALWVDGFEDYRMLPLIYELDNRDEWSDPSYWAKANPGLGKIKSIQTLKDNVDKAKRDPSFLPTVLTKDFNIPENSSESWLPYEAVVNETVVPMDYLRESYAIGGCDLSSTTDLTCATLLIRKPDDEREFILQKYFLPEMRVNQVERIGAREAPYRLWADQGWLKICPGASVDFHAVTDWFVKMVHDYDIRPLWVCYDRALAGYWQNEMSNLGFDMEKIPQGPFTWSSPMKQMGGALAEKRIVYQNNPMLRWCLLNTGKKSQNKDGIETIQPVKVSSNLRIDGTVSMLNAYVGYLKHYEDFMRYVR